MYRLKMDTIMTNDTYSNGTQTINLSLPGMIPFFPNIPVMDWEGEFNTTECVCSDIQREDYSPMFEWANFITIILALPILSVFGVLTNFINVFLYSRKRLSNSANTYLLYLACSDFMVIITGLFIFWIDSARSYIPELTHAPYTTVYTLPFGYMAQTCSIYFTVAAAVDCFVNVCWPRQARYYCTVHRARQICISIVVVSVMYNSLRFPEFNLRKCFNNVTQQQIIEICPTSLYITINVVYNMYMYMVLMTLLPFLFLLFLNAIIMQRQNQPKQGQQAKSEGASDDTITMIMVVILFLACNTLALVVNLIETFSLPSPVLLNFLTDTSNFLVVFNSSVNCIIYYIFNADYRDLMQIYSKRLFERFCEEYCCCCVKSSAERGFGNYQPVSMKDKNGNNTNGGVRIRLAQVECGSDLEIVSEADRNSPPIWEPITNRNLPNIDWPNTVHLMSARDDDGDSGWDDVSQVSSRPTTRWLAEVNIVENETAGCHPQIVVRPIGTLPPVDKEISVTAL